MKKILFAVAIVIAIGVTAFTESKSSNQPPDLYWFEVEDGYGLESSFNNSEATFIPGITQPSSVVPDPGCSSGNSYKCVIGFTSDQLMDDDVTLIDDQLGDVVPADPTARKRGSL